MVSARGEEERAWRVSTRQGRDARVQRRVPRAGRVAARSSRRIKRAKNLKVFDSIERRRRRCRRHKKRAAETATLFDSREIGDCYRIRARAGAIT